MPLVYLPVGQVGPLEVAASRIWVHSSLLFCFFIFSESSVSCLSFLCRELSLCLCGTCALPDTVTQFVLLRQSQRMCEAVWADVPVGKESGNQKRTQCFAHREQPAKGAAEQQADDLLLYQQQSALL